jgi:hypothetical protein
MKTIWKLSVGARSTEYFESEEDAMKRKEDIEKWKKYFDYWLEDLSYTFEVKVKPINVN